MYLCFEYCHAEMNFKSAIFFPVFVNIFPALSRPIQLIFLHETEFDTFLTHISSWAKRGMKCVIISNL